MWRASALGGPTSMWRAFGAGWSNLHVVCLRGCSIFEFAVVHHLGNFEFAVELDCLPNLKHKLNLTTTRFNKGFSINYSWKHKLRTEPVLEPALGN